MLAVEQVGLVVEELLDLVLGSRLGGAFYGSRMYSPSLHLVAHRRFRGAAVGRGLDYRRAFSTCRPRSGAEAVTQSPPSEDRPWWHFQKFSRSSALLASRAS